MIFCFVWISSHCSGGLCGLFWYCRVAFHSGVRTDLLSSFWWWDNVCDEVMISLQ